MAEQDRLEVVRRRSSRRIANRRSHPLDLSFAGYSASISTPVTESKVSVKSAGTSKSASADSSKKTQIPDLPSTSKKHETPIYNQVSHVRTECGVTSSENYFRLDLFSLPEDLVTTATQSNLDQLHCELVAISATQLQLVIHIPSAEGMFSCSTCKAKFNRMSRLKQHQLMTHQMGFKNIDALSTHVKNNHSPYTCKICGARCISFADLQTHVQLHQNICPHCFVNFGSPDLLASHMKKLHDYLSESLMQEEGGIMGAPFGWQELDSGPYSDDSMDNTNASQGSNQKNQMSSTSNVLSPTADALQYAGGSARPDSYGRYTCESCNKSFKTAVRLGIHIKQRHENGGQGFYCSICDKSFEDREQCEEHRLEHRKNPTCHICSVTFSSTSNLSAHIKRHFNNEKATYPCNICNINVEGPRKNLASHMRSVHGIRLMDPDPATATSFFGFSDSGNTQGGNSGSSETLRRRVEAGSAGRLSIKCPICNGFIANNRASILEHRWKAHRVPVEYSLSEPDSEDDEEGYQYLIVPTEKDKQLTISDNFEEMFWSNLRTTHMKTLGEVTEPAPVITVPIEDALKTVQARTCSSYYAHRDSASNVIDIDSDEPEVCAPNPGAAIQQSLDVLNKIKQHRNEKASTMSETNSGAESDPAGSRSQDSYSSSSRSSSKRRRKKRPYMPSKMSDRYCKLVKSMIDKESETSDRPQMEHLAQLVTHGIAPIPDSSSKDIRLQNDGDSQDSYF
ncbi:unnamed protein product [Cyprideis torosa]|uniref:Uncharacterized protein n=1 Tax=Cyprideis torosa TaxID=163714 RepID=A0A7R8ZLE4_9CRUS|nr:unnamed protein product [Cyprideis torosa]CAG0883477.1 unnamed protein product [Cyprideis torosa]